MVKYTYDSWGKIISVKNASGQEITDQNNIAHINPYKYRGYRYDKETGLYYLQSRYYNPEWGRFVNIDSQLNNNLVGNNLYAYCNNNPVNLADYSGCSPLLLLGIPKAFLAVLGIGLGLYFITGIGIALYETIVDFSSSTSKSTSINATNNQEGTIVTTNSGNVNSNNNENDKDFNNRLNSKTQTTTKNTAKKDYSQVSTFKYSNTIMKKHTILERPYMNSSQLIREIVNSTTPAKDLSKNLINGLKWTTKGSFNGTQGIWELVADMDSRTIVHFLFKGGI